MQWLFVKIKYLYYNYKCNPSLPNLKIKCLAAAVACIERFKEIHRLHQLLIYNYTKMLDQR